MERVAQQWPPWGGGEIETESSSTQVLNVQYKYRCCAQQPVTGGGMKRPMNHLVCVYCSNRVCLYWLVVAVAASVGVEMSCLHTGHVLFDDSHVEMHSARPGPTAYRPTTSDVPINIAAVTTSRSGMVRRGWEGPHSPLWYMWRHRSTDNVSSASYSHWQTRHLQRARHTAHGNHQPHGTRPRSSQRNHPTTSTGG